MSLIYNKKSLETFVKLLKSCTLRLLNRLPSLPAFNFLFYLFTYLFIHVSFCVLQARVVRLMLVVEWKKPVKFSKRSVIYSMRDRYKLPNLSYVLPSYCLYVPYHRCLMYTKPIQWAPSVCFLCVQFLQQFESYLVEVVCKFVSLPDWMELMVPSRLMVG